jgi:hypothetical protein
VVSLALAVASLGRLAEDISSGSPVLWIMAFAALATVLVAALVSFLTRR